MKITVIAPNCQWLARFVIVVKVPISSPSGFRGCAVFTPFAMPHPHVPEVCVLLGFENDAVFSPPELTIAGTALVDAATPNYGIAALRARWYKAQMAVVARERLPGNFLNDGFIASGVNNIKTAFATPASFLVNVGLLRKPTVFCTFDLNENTDACVAHAAIVVATPVDSDEPS